MNMVYRDGERLLACGRPRGLVARTGSGIFAAVKECSTYVERSSCGVSRVGFTMNVVELPKVSTRYYRHGERLLACGRPRGLVARTGSGIFAGVRTLAVAKKSPRLTLMAGLSKAV
jgi:hypothetical protein